ncbi:Rnf-Nqr domain containing protein [Pseudomonas sp. NPDC089401]|uniref:Rnf-Nqr domain containing protein n=1 Tax=Pseudomonas sp. NPDC089401 TaxID=3364462 RepID=UPI0037F35D55
MNDYVLILVSAAVVGQLLMQRQPAGRPHLHVCGLACALSITLGIGGGQLLERLLVAPAAWQDLRLFLLLPWLASLGWGVPRALARLRPHWPQPAHVTLLPCNVVTLGVALQVMDERSAWLATCGWALLCGLGYWLALALFDDLLQRCEQAELPAPLRGLPIALISAGVMTLAFSGFKGLFTQ